MTRTRPGSRNAGGEKAPVAAARHEPKEEGSAPGAPRTFHRHPPACEREEEGRAGSLPHRFGVWVLALLCGFGSAQSDVGYFVEGSWFDGDLGLVARRGDAAHAVLEDELPPCSELVAQRDFDGGGYTDALMRDVLACGGSGMGDEHFFVFSDGRTFHRTENFGYTWDAATIERREGAWAVRTVAANAGSGADDEVVLERHHVLQNGRAVLVSERRATELPALVEMRARELADLPPLDTRDLAYDLDGDGREDILRCSFWARWDSLMCGVSFDGGRTFIESFPRCRRIGVSESMTDGVHDLVCGSRDILVWRGDRYETRRAPAPPP